ncbi:hypothetical protein GW17_00042248 [Ensete ventricosum]|nr:hypothetical protein GW17_00042248 [Ensete ventricosum]
MIEGTIREMGQKKREKKNLESHCSSPALSVARRRFLLYRSISIVDGRFRVVSTEGGRKKKREKREKKILESHCSSPMLSIAHEQFLLPTRGEEMRPRMGRRNEVMKDFLHNLLTEYYCPDVVMRQAAMVVKCVLLIYYKNFKGRGYRKQVCNFDLYRPYISVRQVAGGPSATRRFERERTCPLCRVLVKPAGLRSFSDGSTTLFFQLF